MPQVFLVTKTVGFRNHCQVQMIAKVFGERRDAQRYIEQAQAETAALLASKLIMSTPQGLQPVGSADMVLAACGIETMQYGIVTAEVSEEKLVVAPPSGLIVPG
jgi:hypothetical protein